jgi:hypothetical protein
VGEETQSKVIACGEGSVRIMVDMISKFSGSDLVLQNAIGLLGMLCWQNEEATAELEGVRGIEKLTAVLKTRKDSLVTQRTLTALGPLAGTASRRDRMMKADLAPSLYQLLLNAEDNDIVTLAAATLCALVQKSPEIQRRLIASNCIQTLLAALERTTCEYSVSK